MDKFLVAPLLLGKLEQRATFLKIFSRLLKVLAWLGAVIAVIGFFLGWKELFEKSSEAMIGGILYQVTFAVAAYLAVHCTLLRAAGIGNATPDRPAALAVATNVFKLAGEAWGFTSTLLGAGSAVYVWFAGREANGLLAMVEPLFPFLKAGPATFAAGAALAAKGLLYGALALLLGYLLAELLQRLPAEAGDPPETAAP